MQQRLMPSANISSRNAAVDFLRFLALFLMVFAHSNMILRVDGSWVNFFLENLGNTICFALFLFCFGASKFYNTTTNVKRLLRRLGLLYLTYAIITILFIIENKIYVLSEILALFLFYRMPSYGEFIVAFLIYELILVAIPSLLPKIASNFLKVLTSGILGFLIGDFLSKFDFGLITPYLALVWGKHDYYSFPILHYAIFVFAGYLYTSIDRQQKVKTHHVVAITAILLLIYTSIKYFNLLNQIEIKRWPPNLEFFTLNLLLISVFLLVWVLVRKYVTEKLVLQVIKLISQKAIHILSFHMVVLYSLRWLGLPGLPLVSFMTTALILVTLPAIEYATKAICNRSPCGN